MTEIGEEDLEFAERIAADADVLKNAWEETIDDMKALAAEYEAEGWDAFYVAAGQTAPEPPDAGPTGRWGLVHVIPDNYADGFVDAFEEGGFPTYEVYRTELSGRVFLLTVLEDPDAETAILICAQYRLADAATLVEATKREGHVFTHVQTLDGTQHGSFRHDDPAKFFPHYDDFAAHVGASSDE